MFSIARKPQSQAQSHCYTPHFSSPLSSSPSATSPLSPRNANLPTPTPIFSNKDMIMSSPTPPTRLYSAKTQSTTRTPTSQSGERLPTPPSTSGTTKSSASIFSKRASKPNPLLHGREDRSEGRETRRKLFLKKVREGSEEKRWKDRGGDEEIMRCLWLAEERRLEERRRKEGLIFDGEEPEELNLDEVMADEVALREEQELEALLMGMNAEITTNNISSDEMDAHHQYQSEIETMQGGPPIQELMQHVFQEEILTPANTAYGSDDDDEYDSIFMGVIEEEIRLSQHGGLSESTNRNYHEDSSETQMQHANTMFDQDMMDMS